MKKISLLTVFALCNFWVLAQTEPAAPLPIAPPAAIQQGNTSAVRLGIELSPLLSWFGSSGSAGKLEPDGTRLNIRYGLNVDFRINDNGNYYFSTGLFMDNLGGTLTYKREEIQDVITQRTTEFRANYLTIPANIMLRTNEIGYVNYFFRVGFDAGFNIRATKDYEEEPILGGAVSAMNDVDATNDFNLFRAGLHLEVGLEYSISGNTRLYGGVEFNNGLNNVLAKDFREKVADADNSNVKAQLSFFAVNLGVYF